MRIDSIARESRMFGNQFVDHFGGTREHEVRLWNQAVTNWEGSSRPWNSICNLIWISSSQWSGILSLHDVFLEQIYFSSRNSAPHDRRLLVPNMQPLYEMRNILSKYRASSR